MGGGADAGSAASPGGTAGGASTPGGTGGTNAGPDLSQEIFDAAAFPRFDLDLPKASTDALNKITTADDPSQDAYVSATFTYDKGGRNEVVQDIGVRIKGTGSFQRFSQKPAFKIKFDEFVANQRFRGLARLTLNNAFDDGSFVAERLAYAVYRAAGVPAPRCNNASVYVNGTFYGVYANVEAEDKHFLKRWFDKDGGNLYEKDGTRDFVPQAEPEFDLETNEKAPDRSDLVKLISTVQAATNPTTFLTDLSTVMDTSAFLKFTAVEAAVNQWDTYSFTVYYIHNFRLYNDPTSGRFSFIPWGLDLSMKPFDGDVRAYIGAFELATELAVKGRRVTAGILFQRCLKSPECKAAYKLALEKVMTTYDGLGLEAEANRHYQQIKAQVYADTKKATFNGPLTNEAFDRAFQAVITTIRGRTAALRADLAAN
jgi:spore coat protein CotH